MNKLFKVGDRPLVKTLEALKKEFDVQETDTMIEGPEHIGMPDTMQEHCGKRVTIETLTCGYYEIKEDNYSWYDWMFEEPTQARILANVIEDKPRVMPEQLMQQVGAQCQTLYASIKKLNRAFDDSKFVDATVHATDVLKALVAVRTLNEACLEFDRAAVIKSLRTEGTVKPVHPPTHGAVNKESIEQAASNVEKLKDK